MNGFLIGLIIFLVVGGITAYFITVKMSSKTKKPCDPPCPPNATCTNGKCTEDPCEDNDECDYHRVCWDSNHCVACNTNKDCTWNKYSPACKNPGQFSQCVECTTDDFCQDPPGKCLGNKCYKMCYPGIPPNGHYRIYTTIGGVKNYVYLVNEYFALSTTQMEGNSFTWTCSTDEKGKGTLYVGSLPVGLACNTSITGGCPGAPHVATDAHQTSWLLTPSGSTFSIEPADYKITKPTCNNDDSAAHPCGCHSLFGGPCPLTGYGWYAQSTAATCSAQGVSTSPCVLCDTSPTPATGSQWSFEWVPPPS
jgi:hypothetical protein